MSLDNVRFEFRKNVRIYVSDRILGYIIYAVTGIQVYQQ